MSSIEAFKSVFGECKVIAKYMEDKVQITTRILNTSDKNEKKRGFQLDVDGEKIWASVWYSGKDGDLPEEAVSMIKSLRKGDEATFDLYKQGEWWNINGIVPCTDVNEPPEKVAEKMVDENHKATKQLNYDISIWSQVAVKEGFATFRTAMTAGADVEVQAVKDYCALAMDCIVDNFKRYAK